MATQEFSLNRADDFHIHLRQGKALTQYVKACLPYFKKILVMPNTLPPLNNVETLFKYKQEIQSVSNDLKVLMTFKLSENLTNETIEDIIKWGVTGGKIYPTGVTTHSEDSVNNIQNLAESFALMQEHNIVLNIHAEKPREFSLHREYSYLPDVQWIINNFPKLRIVIEHISDRRTINFVKQAGPNVVATITVHHLLFTLDNIIGKSISPHHFCKPIPKFPEDLKALQEVVFSGDPSFFLGTDSAPHLKDKKECASGCAGIFSSPVAIPILINLFEKAGKLPFLNSFTSKFGADFYQLQHNSETLYFQRKPKIVPPVIGGVVPLYANKSLPWSLYEK